MLDLPPEPHVEVRGQEVSIVGTDVRCNVLHTRHYLLLEAAAARLASIGNLPTFRPSRARQTGLLLLGCGVVFGTRFGRLRVVIIVLLLDGPAPGVHDPKVERS